MNHWLLQRKTRIRPGTWVTFVASHKYLHSYWGEGPFKVTEICCFPSKYGNDLYWSVRVDDLKVGFDLNWIEIVKTESEA